MHLGVIPDGNRRYAREHDIPKKESYRKAKEVILEAFEDIDDLPVDIDELTIYLLWENNLKRDSEDLQTLFELLKEQIEETANQFNGEGFSVNWATTNPGAIPRGLRKKLRRLEKEKSQGEKQLNLLISYDGKNDLIQAAEELSEEGEDINKQSLKSRLEVQTDIDFVIRTGDNPTRECLSGFPIWNSSYAEYYHVKKHFPALETQDFIEALEHYKDLRRKKGE